jgi:hypothetical protein
VDVGTYGCVLSFQVEEWYGSVRVHESESLT